MPNGQGTVIGCGRERINKAGFEVNETGRDGMGWAACEGGYRRFTTPTVG